MKNLKTKAFVLAMMVLVLSSIPSPAQQTDQATIDKKVKAFFQEHGRWRNMNVPTSDGQLLHDLILENNYQSALEIGTSTGHSTIWMAWALSKTGGKHNPPGNRYQSTS